MDMYWAHIIESQLKKQNDLSLDNKPVKSDKKIFLNCSYCGQNPYFCQCPPINKSPKDESVSDIDLEQITSAVDSVIDDHIFRYSDPLNHKTA